jgi:hypothetical protein
MSSSNIPPGMSSQSSSNTFDPHICASLHNKIISFLTPHAAEHNNYIVHNFFEAYGEDAQAIRGHLSQPLITFLENIDIIISEDASSPVMNFAPHLSMPNPSEFWALSGGLDNFYGEDHENWVVLYMGIYTYILAFLLYQFADQII